MATGFLLQGHLPDPVQNATLTDVIYHCLIIFAVVLQTTALIARNMQK